MASPKSTDVGTARRASAGYLAAETVARLSELTLFATLGVVGWRLGGNGLMGVAVAGLCPSLAVLIWSLWLAPGAAHRLSDPGRLITQIGLFLAAALLGALSGLLVWGVALAGVGISASVARRLLDIRPHR
ncbi:MAG: YrdB family protein [Jatrophihabitantaceae bacterium]